MAVWGLFSNGFLPAQHQASIIKADEEEAVDNIRPLQPFGTQRRQLDFIGALDRKFANEAKHDIHVEAAISNYELAWRMQSAVPELCDISGESAGDEKASTALMALTTRAPLTAAMMLARTARLVWSAAYVSSS